MQEPNHHIDRLFQKDLLTHEVVVTDRDHLWSRIRPERRTYRGLLLFTFGVLGILATIYSTIPTNYSNGGGGTEEDLVDAIAPETDEDRSNHLVQLLEEANVISDDTEIELSESENVKLSSLTIIKSYLEKPTTAKATTQSQSGVLDRPNSKKDELENNSNELTKSFYNQMSAKDMDANIGAPSTQKGAELVSVSTHTSNSQRRLGAETPAIQSLESQLWIGDIGRVETPMYDLPKNQKKLACEFKTKQRLYLDVYGALALPIERVNLSASSADLTTYRDEWISRYKPVSSISGGISLGYQLTPKIDVSVGMEYQRVETQYRTTRTVTEIIRVFDPMAYFYHDDMGAVVWVADSVTAVRQYDRTTSLPTTTHLLSTPLQISYAFSQSGPWNVKLSASGIFNWSIHQRGQYLREDLTLMPVDRSNESLFVRPRVDLSVELGAHVGYFVQDQLEVYMSPRFRYNPTSYHPRSAALSLTRHFLGLRTGIQYHF